MDETLAETAGSFSHLTDAEVTLWKAYRHAQAKSQDLTQVRNALLEFYLPTVAGLAQKLASRIPGGAVAADELAGEGVMGLMDAIESFEEERGNRFTTHASHRVMGAMRDYLRSLDQAPRLVRSRQRALDTARNAFYARHGRKPSDEECREQLKLEDTEFRRVLSDGEARGQFSLDATRPDTGGDRERDFREGIADDRAADPKHEAMKKSLKDLVCKELSRAERLIVMLYFYEGMTLREIGVTLALSESRVSQMLTLIREKLKAKLHERDGEFALVA